MDIVKIDITFTDGSVKTITPGTPPVALEETEVDVVMSDGSTKTFVPKA